MNSNDVWGALAGLGAVAGLAALAGHRKPAAPALPSSGEWAGVSGGIMDACKNYTPKGVTYSGGVNPLSPSYNQIHEDDDIAVRRAKEAAQQAQMAKGIAGLGSWLSGDNGSQQMPAPVITPRPQTMQPQIMQAPSLTAGQYNQPRYF